MLVCRFLVFLFLALFAATSVHAATLTIPPTGAFKVSGGRVYDPNGVAFTGSGINVGDDMLPYAAQNSAAKPLTTLFPGINLVRLNTGSDNPGSATANYPSPSFYQTFIQNLTGYTRQGDGSWRSTSSQHIAVVLEDHDQNRLDPPFTGQALQRQTAWYAACASYYAGNPYVMYGTQNEMNTGDRTYSPSAFAAMTLSHVAIYNAVRSGSPTALVIIMAGAGGSNPGTVGAGAGYTVSSYASMTNIMFETHPYYSNGEAQTAGTTYATTATQSLGGGTSVPGSGAGGGWGIIGAQTIQSADGIVPVLAGEWGADGGDPSGAGSSEMANALKAAAANGVWQTAWQWWPSQFDNGPWDAVTGGKTYNPTITGWGSVIAGVIAANAPVATQPGKYFSVSGQNILTPGGAVFTGRGIAINPGIFLNQNSAGQPVTRLFPNINFIRLALSLGSCTYDFNSNLPAQYAQVINYFTALGVVILVENHAYPQTAPDNATSCSVQTGAALVAEQAWYAKWAAYFINNPYVWFGTPNEPVWCAGTCSQAPVTTEHVAVYNAIRGTGSNTIIELEGIAGNYEPYNGANCQTGWCLTPLSSYLAMTNVIWGPHYYSGCYDSGCPVQTLAWYQNDLKNHVQNAQTIPTGNGTAPAIIAEFGPSNTGIGYDTNGLVTIQSVFTSGYSGLAWIFNGNGGNPTTTDELVDGGGNLTTNFGTYVAQWTSLNGTTVVTPTSGNSTWNPADTAGGVTLSSSNSVATLIAKGGVRSTSSKSSGKWCLGVTLPSVSGNMAIGIGIGSDDLTGFIGGSGSNAIGLYPEYGGQQIYQNGTALRTGTSGGASAGDSVTIALDVDAQKVWFQDTAMIAASQPWNDSATENPVTGAGGISTSAMSPPYFLEAAAQEGGAAYAVNFRPSNCPAGFATWDAPVSSNGRPIVVILGSR